MIAATPSALRYAGGLIGLQGVGLLVVAVVLAVRGVRDGGTSGGLITGSWFAIAGLAVAIAGVALVRGQRWARSFGLVIQLLLIPVVWSFATTGAVPAAVAMGLYVVVVLALLFTSASVRWARGLDDDPTE